MNPELPAVIEKSKQFARDQGKKSQGLLFNLMLLHVLVLLGICLLCALIKQRVHDHVKEIKIFIFQQLLFA